MFVNKSKLSAEINEAVEREVCKYSEDATVLMQELENKIMSRVTSVVKVEVAMALAEIADAKANCKCETKADISKLATKTTKPKTTKKVTTKTEKVEEA